MEPAHWYQPWLTPEGILALISLLGMMATTATTVWKAIQAKNYREAGAASAEALGSVIVGINELRAKGSPSSPAQIVEALSRHAESPSTTVRARGVLTQAVEASKLLPRPAEPASAPAVAEVVTRAATGKIPRESLEDA